MKISPMKTDYQEKYNIRVVGYSISKKTITENMYINTFKIFFKMNSKLKYDKYIEKLFEFMKQELDESGGQWKLIYPTISSIFFFKRTRKMTEYEYEYYKKQNEQKKKSIEEDKKIKIASEKKKRRDKVYREKKKLKKLLLKYSCD